MSLWPRSESRRQRSRNSVQTGVNLLNCCGADAWQTVFHFHLHVIPRYVDKAKDRLVLPWQPGTPPATWRRSPLWAVDSSPPPRTAAFHRLGLTRAVHRLRMDLLLRRPMQQSAPADRPRCRGASPTTHSTAAGPTPERLGCAVSLPHVYARSRSATARNFERSTARRDRTPATVDDRIGVGAADFRSPDPNHVVPGGQVQRSRPIGPRSRMR